MARTPNAPQRPFVTRWSTLGFTALSVVSAIVAQAMTTDGASISAPAALAIATFDISLIVSWIAGFILALRSRRLLFMILACIPPPLGPLICALWAPEAPKA